MIKKFFIIFSFVALVTAVTTVYGAEETAIQKCWHHILDAKDNQQRKATIAFKDCVRKETSTSTSTSKLKWPKSVDKEEKNAEKALAKQAKLEEKERIKAEKAAIKAEKKRLKAEWKKACAEDPESKACIEGKPTQKLKKTLSKIKKSLGG